ncbi:hypothetical protein ACER0A_009175 [Haloimpatiens sp. FM7315]|uniref:hypothetical protein n=1 Tax=Haloimpatiens sp. FM7315 TaxID=3298609 RepID=UPI00370C8A04
MKEAQLCGCNCNCDEDKVLIKTCDGTQIVGKLQYDCNNGIVIEQKYLDCTYYYSIPAKSIVYIRYCKKK